MSQEFKQLDIPALTKSVEHGDGCALRSAIEDLGFEERFRTLKLIQNQNEKDNIDDPSVPKLIASSRSGGSRWSENKFYLDLKIDSGSLFTRNTPLYSDVLSAYTGVHNDKCWTLTEKPKP